MQIIALHGNLGSAADWQRVEAAYGKSFVHVDLWSRVADYTNFTRRLLAEIPDGSVLLGYSLGARLAMHLLAGAPAGKFHAAVLISGHPGLATAEERSQRLAADAVWAKRAATDDWAAFLAAWEAQSVFSNTTARQLPSEEHRQAIAAAFDHWSLGKQRDFRAVFQQSSNLPQHCYWLTGAQDAKFSALAAGIGSPWQCVSLPGGHRLPWDAPDAIASLLKTTAE